MYNIATPLADPTADFDWVAGSKSAINRARLTGLRPAVLNAYVDYVRHGQTIWTVTPQVFAPADDTLLYSLFSRLDLGKPCSAIRTDILASTKSGLCCYCRLHDATTLDHILERDDFPEFSVLRVNLAPVCERCNSKKQHNRGKAGGRPPFHLYFFGYPSANFLQADVAIDGRRIKVKYSLSRPTSYRPEWFSALERHFEAVELGDRYGRRAHSELQDRAIEMQRQHRIGGPSRVAKFLHRDADSRSARWSDNDWLVVSLRAAADNPEFCDRGIALL